jgi:predicted RNA binding protein YcfA (HicA-like mRNA interferase family)
LSTKLPVVTADQLLRALRSAGWIEVRRRGSHARLERGDRRTSVAVHAGRTIPPGTLKAILDDVGMTAAELRELL